MVVVKEITVEEILIFVIVLIIFFIIITILTTLTYISKKIHNSYHKGYNEARNDKYNYFENLRDLDDIFTKIMSDIRKRDIDVDVNFLTNLIDFGKKVRKYKNKN